MSGAGEMVSTPSLSSSHCQGGLPSQHGKSPEATLSAAAAGAHREVSIAPHNSRPHSRCFHFLIISSCPAEGDTPLADSFLSRLAGRSISYAL